MKQAQPVTLYHAVTRVMVRLDDHEGKVWTPDELIVYIKDGYDIACREAKPVWDMEHIENLPAVGSHSSDEEFELLRQIPGLVVAGKRNFTRAVDKDFSSAGDVGPASASVYLELPFFDTLDIPKAQGTGQLPRDVVDVEVVRHDHIPLYPEFSAEFAHVRDNRYETQGGDPSWFTMDKDGMFTLRRYPTGDGAAVYQEVIGHYGVETEDEDFDGEIIGDGWGAMSYDPEHFPSRGPWGAPTRTHPDDNNTRAEILRLGRDLEEYPFEIPSAHVRYIEFWACSRALKREGPGQDLKLSKHYAERFNTGIHRMKDRVRSTQDEYVGRIGHGPQRVTSMSVNLPYNYGASRKRRRGY